MEKATKSRREVEERRGDTFLYTVTSGTLSGVGEEVDWRFLSGRFLSS